MYKPLQNKTSKVMWLSREGPSGKVASSSGFAIALPCFVLLHVRKSIHCAAHITAIGAAMSQASVHLRYSYTPRCGSMKKERKSFCPSHVLMLAGGNYKHELASGGHCENASNSCRVLVLACGRLSYNSVAKPRGDCNVCWHLHLHCMSSQDHDQVLGHLQLLP